MASPYEILGVDPDAEDDEIVQAFRERVKEVHPDQGGSVSEFRTVKTAYEQLQNGDTTPIHNGDSGTDAGSEEPEPTSDPGATEQADPEPEPTEPEGARVEYLDYEVLDDHGWDIGDDDLFEKASEADLDPADYGRFVVKPSETLLEAAENRGFAWPFACRGGACTNCAVAVVDGEIPEPKGHILSPELIDEGIRLSCISAPVSEDTQVIYNVKHMPGVNEFLLSPSRFEKAQQSR